jgi:hypothetical protein
METAFVSMVCVVLIVIGGMTMSRGFLSSIDSTSANIDSLSQRNEEIMRTNIQVLSAIQTSGNRLEVTLQNTGQVKLADFGQWDVIVHHMDNSDQFHVTWMPYSSQVLGENEWNVQGIYTLNDTAEVFEPGIFNPDEKLVIQVDIDPEVKAESTNQVLLTTPNGVTVSKSFVGY